MDKQPKNSISFTAVSELLQGLGFAGHTVKGSHHLFTRDELSISLPLAKRGRIPGYYVAAIARPLDEWGFMKREDVERKLNTGPRDSHNRSQKRVEGHAA